MTKNERLFEKNDQKLGVFEKPLDMTFAEIF